MTGLTIAQWVRAAIARSEMSQAEMARRLERELRRSFDRSMVYKILKEERDVSASELVAIERITGHPVPSYLRPDIVRVPLIAWAAVGALADHKAQVPNDSDLVAFADLGKGEFFALRVEDDSMDRVSPPGAVVLVNRADRTLVTGRFYVFLARRQVAYRRWQASPPRLDPWSTNPAHEPIFLNRRRDVDVIGRVQRTVLEL